ATLPASLCAETGYNAWLRYAPLSEVAARPYRDSVPAVVANLGSNSPERSAQQELIRGLRGMLNRNLREDSRVPAEAAIILGTLTDLQKSAPQLGLTATLPPDGFWLKSVTVNRVRYTVITAQNDRGVLYGGFAFLRRIALNEPVTDLDIKQTPS